MLVTSIVKRGKQFFKIKLSHEGSRRKVKMRSIFPAL